MQHQPIDVQPLHRRGIRRDLLLAIVLAVALDIGWAIAEWPRLSRLLLPDSDDIMRLAQVRDWIAGQGINDWTQYRLAPPAGAPMHWSRLGDAGIAAIILALRPLVGTHLAELTAVLLYPVTLFACAIFLSSRIARRLWGDDAGPVAAVLTGVAYPGTTVFIPGRIDHHGLQVVLIQILVLALTRVPSLSSGLVAGTMAALCLVVGLETAPQLAALVAVVALLWVNDGVRERIRLAGFAGALGVTTLIFLAFLRPTYWSTELCDAFTPASSTATLAVAAALFVLAFATPWLGGWRWRLGIGSVLGAAVIGGTLAAYPVCLTGPYGRMDPFLVTALISHIGEASSVLAQGRLIETIALGGVLTAAAVMSLWALARAPRRWPLLLPVVAVVLSSAVVMLAQIRGTYIGAPVGAAVLAGLIISARRCRRFRLPAIVAAWLAGSGLAYYQIPFAIDAWLIADPAHAAKATTSDITCGSGDVWAQIDRYPPGVVMTATGLAPSVIGATHHSAVGASYHRNNAGNMAMYRFFLDPPARSLRIAQAWKTDYVAFCPGDFGEIHVTSDFPNSLATRLTADRPPAWLRRVPLRNTHLRFYRVVR